MTVYITGARMLDLTAIDRAARYLTETIGAFLPASVDLHQLAAQTLISAHVYAVPVVDGGRYQTIDREAPAYAGRHGRHNDPCCPFPTPGHTG